MCQECLLNVSKWVYLCEYFFCVSLVGCMYRTLWLKLPKNCWMRRKRWMYRNEPIVDFWMWMRMCFWRFACDYCFLHDDLWINDFNSFCIFITYNFICFLCSFILTYFYFFFSNSRVTILFICFNAVLSFCLTIYVPCCRLFVYKCVNVVVFVCMPLISICVDILYQHWSMII